MRNRLGSYKKILISPSLLRVNKDYLQENLKALMSMSLLKEDLATLYILLFLRIKHPKNWLQKFQTPPLSIVPAAPLLAMIPESFALNAWEREKLKGVSGPQLFSSFHLKGVGVRYGLSVSAIIFSIGIFLAVSCTSFALLKVTIPEKLILHFGDNFINFSAYSRFSL